MGLLICYDLRFAEEALLLRRAGAQILTYPSAFTVETGMSHWEALLRARAIENQTYIIAAAQSGRHNARRTSFGHSMIVDPWGTIVAQCTDEMDVAVAEINLDRVEWIRTRMPVSQHRRYDLYGLTPRLGAVSPSQPPELCGLADGKLCEPDIAGNGSGSHQNPVAVGNDAEDEGRGSDADPLTPPEAVHGIDSTSTATTVAAAETFKFAHIAIPSEHVFYYTQFSFAFVNLKPVLPGHVLVAPRRHVESLHELSSEELADLFAVVQLVERVVFVHFNATASTITVQNGPDAGQSVPAVHVHILPRRKGDFEHNDDVYVELQRDAGISDSGKSPPAPLKGGVDSDRQPRKNNVMVAEARELHERIEKLAAASPSVRKLHMLLVL